MSRPDPIAENMSFLLAELDGQLTRLIAYFDSPRTEIALQLVQRAGYSHNLSVRVRKACLAGMMRGKTSGATQLRLQGIDTIARNLDLISRLGRRAVEQAERVDRQKLLRAETYGPPLKRVRKTVARINEALEARDSKLAVQIGQVIRNGLAILGVSAPERM